jgi:hypothetical protein
LYALVRAGVSFAKHRIFVRATPRVSNQESPRTVQSSFEAAGKTRWKKIRGENSEVLTFA